MTSGNPLPVRVYWEDTDAGGVVYYANYLKFFERTRTEWLRTLGVEQRVLQQKSGLLFVVTEVKLRYLAPARLDDLLTVDVRVLRQGPASVELEQHAWKADSLLAKGQVRVGCVDAVSLRPCRIPQQIAILLSSP